MDDMNKTHIRIDYRIGNILSGGKKHGVTAWENVVKYFPGSLCEKYINLRTHNTRTLNNLINEYDSPSPSPDECVIHVRLGDIINDSIFTVEEHLSKNLISPNVINILRVPTKSYYTDKLKKIEQIKEIKKITICTCFHKSTGIDKNEDNFKSLKYLNEIKKIFENKYEVKIINQKLKPTWVVKKGTAPSPTPAEFNNYIETDKDFIFMCKSKYFVKSYGSFSKNVSKVVLLRKGILL